MTVYGGACETITLTSSDGISEECVTDANGESTATVKVGETYTVVGGISGYEKTAIIEEDTTIIKAMPDNTLYWYGIMTKKLIWWASSYGSSPTVTFNTNCISVSKLYYGIDFRTESKMLVSGFSVIRVKTEKLDDYICGQAGITSGKTSLKSYPESEVNSSLIIKYVGEWGYSVKNSSRGIFAPMYEKGTDISDVNGEYYVQCNFYGSGYGMSTNMYAIYIE